jgi:hypothetical protein
VDELYARVKIAQVLTRFPVYYNVKSAEQKGKTMHILLSFALLYMAGMIIIGLPLAFISFGVLKIWNRPKKDWHWFISLAMFPICREMGWDPIESAAFAAFLNENGNWDDIVQKSDHIFGAHIRYVLLNMLCWPARVAWNITAIACIVAHWFWKDDILPMLN